MAGIIKLDNCDGLPALLTTTGAGGLLRRGSLRDRSAASDLRADEQARFVLTNRKRGVEVVRSGESERIEPGDGYRTIAVVTDRRLVVAVGDAGEDGDRRVTFPLGEVEAVEVESGLRHGTVTLTRTGGTAVRVHCGTDGLTDVVEFLRAGSQIWLSVETTLEDVRRHVVAATERRDSGEYGDALAAIERARTRLADATETASRFERAYDSDAVANRVADVRERCLDTEADIHVGRARELADRAEGHWRAGDYEAARDTYERARAELDVSDGREHERVAAERERLSGAISRLERAPLRRAVTADNAAIEAEDVDRRADLWAAALERYRTAVELDWGADRRRFAGDPERIQERMSTVAEQLTAALRTVASETMAAGDWHREAGQRELARETYQEARTQYERALSTARDCYPDAVDHLEAELEALAGRLRQVSPERDGPSAGAAPVDDGETSTDASGSLSEPTGVPEPAADLGIDVTAEPGDSSDGGSDAEPVELRLRSLDRPAVVETVAAALAATRWETRVVDGEAYDVLATDGDSRMAVVVHHRPGGTPVTTEAAEDAATLCERERFDSVTVAATAPIEGHVERQGVRLIDGTALASVVESEGIPVPHVPGPGN